jgi:D-alanyl-D-alanine carboxypeptidase
MGQLCLVMLVFLSNTSFAPPTFAYASVNAPIEEVAEVTVADTEAFEDEEVMAQMENDHASVNTEDVANLDDLIETSKETADALVEVSQADSVDGAEYADAPKVTFDKNDWKLLLINKQHTIPEDYEFTLGTIKGSMRCDERIIEPLTQMFAAAKQDGVNLIVCSPYRDMARQEYLFDRKVKNYQSTGMSYMDAYKKASITVTLPGASEHQVGLAVDVISDTYTSLEVGFADTEAGKWLAKHSWEYGFILRYPLGKEEITGIQFEPWHFRYVGIDAAEVITSQNITLEEFVENL